MTTLFEIGTEVVCTKGNGSVGKIGRIAEIDSAKNRYRVEWLRFWDEETSTRRLSRTWIAGANIAPTSQAYAIEFYKAYDKRCKVFWDACRYKVLA